MWLVRTERTVAVADRDGADAALANLTKMDGNSDVEVRKTASA